MRRNSINTKGIFLICISVILASCTKNDDLFKLYYGTSFNMCIGYCKNEITLESGFITYNHSGWVDTVETITCTDNLENDDWTYYKTQLDINEFFKLPETIGCPDCADGGAEWIEIELDNGDKHKVTFEYMNEPSFLDEYSNRLREQIQGSTYCSGI